MTKTTQVPAEEKSAARRLVLAVADDEDVGVIGVDDDALMRTPRSLVASGALVISVTGSLSRWRGRRRGDVDLVQSVAVSLMAMRAAFSPTME